MKYLVIEDDRAVAEMVKAGLAAQSHTVEISGDGADGSFLARSYEYDAIVLDYSLPKKDGLAVCREIRAAGKSTPIVFLSVNSDSDTKLAAFNLGADDYVSKPFSLPELYARLRAISGRSRDIKSQILTVDDLVMDVDRHTVARGGETVTLTHKEFGLLEYLVRNAGLVVSRALLMERVWSADSDVFSNTVEAHIRNIRRKIKAGGKPDLIRNIPGRGYVIGEPI